VRRFVDLSDPMIANVMAGLGDGEGGISPATLHTGGANFLFGDGSVRSVMGGFVDDVWHAMEFGVHGENWTSLPAVQMPPTLRGGGLFTFQNVGLLTDLYVSDRRLRDRLQRAVRQALAADERGDLRLVDRAAAAYVKDVQDARGIGLTAFQADTAANLMLVCAAGRHIR
jgi:prepilin-type processing-associated H-X9-DG protein